MLGAARRRDGEHGVEVEARTECNDGLGRSTDGEVDLGVVEAGPVQVEQQCICSRHGSSGSMATTSLATASVCGGPHATVRMHRPEWSGGCDARMRRHGCISRMRQAGPARRPVGAPCESVSVSLNFTAIDFETANGSNVSACSVGLVKVRDGRVVDRVAWFIRPPCPHDEFNEWNIRIHGIEPEQCADALQVERPASRRARLRRGRHAGGAQRGVRPRRHQGVDRVLRARRARHPLSVQPAGRPTHLLARLLSPARCRDGGRVRGLQPSRCAGGCRGVRLTSSCMRPDATTPSTSMRWHA